jgi:hypothetical protein
METIPVEKLFLFIWYIVVTAILAPVHPMGWPVIYRFQADWGIHCQDRVPEAAYCLGCECLVNLNHVKIPDCHTAIFIAFSLQAQAEPPYMLGQLRQLRMILFLLWAQVHLFSFVRAHHENCCCPVIYS